MKKHWTEALKKENEELKKKISDLQFQPHLVRFASEVGNNIMLMLANTSFDKWPELAKIAYRHAQEHQETTAYLYKQRLPH